MALLTLCGDHNQFTKVKVSSVAEVWVHNRNLNVSIDSDDHTLTVRDRNDDIVVVNEQNVSALNGTTWSVCKTAVDNYMIAFT